MNNRFEFYYYSSSIRYLLVVQYFLGFRLVTEGLIRNIHGLTITAILSWSPYYIFLFLQFILEGREPMPVSMKSLRL